MKTRFLFPHKLRKVSGGLFLLSFVFVIGLLVDYSIFSMINPKLPVFAVAGNGELVFGGPSSTDLFQTHYFSWIYNEILDEMVVLLFLTSGLMYAFTKEKVEDEMILKLRLESLAWATYFNGGILLLCYLLFYGIPFLKIILVSMCSNIVFFIIRFRWVVYKYNQNFNEE